tara:strand:+ start:294 stop:431 length:138 start_codon:yes stop_codon:yes gene_type:complete
VKLHYWLFLDEQQAKASWPIIAGIACYFLMNSKQQLAGLTANNQL